MSHCVTVSRVREVAPFKREGRGTLTPHCPDVLFYVQFTFFVDLTYIADWHEDEVMLSALLEASFTYANGSASSSVQDELIRPFFSFAIRLPGR